ncbi:MAG TPA: peptidase U32, partial [Treponema sp.]|nr:peptidase U32 [Treponema sp.]
AYRYVLDHWQEDKKAAIETAKRILATDFARKKTSYWYESSSAENLLDPKQAGGTGIYLGKIEKIRYHEKTKQPYIFLRGGSYEPEIGDSIRLHKKDDSNRVSHKVKEILEYAGDLFIDAPKGFSNGDTVYLLQTKSMS